MVSYICRTHSCFNTNCIIDWQGLKGVDTKDFYSCGGFNTLLLCNVRSASRLLITKLISTPVYFNCGDSFLAVDTSL